MSAEAPPGFAQHIYRCSFAAPYSIERVVLQALHKESAQEGIFVQDGLLHKSSARCLARVSTGRERRGCEKIACKAAKARWDKKRQEVSS